MLKLSILSSGFHRATLLALALALTALPANAQTPPEAAPADVESLDAIMAAVYDVISGPAGEARDWDRFRSLFAPGARLIPIGRPAADAPPQPLVWSVDDYVGRAGSQLQQDGFFEDEIGRTVDTYGHLTHAFSSYQSKRTEDGDVFARGINSFQLLDDGERWWVVSIFWQSETPEFPIPGKYIGG